MSGTQCPGVNGGSVHSSTITGTGARPATGCPHGVQPGAQPGHQRPAAAPRPVADPTVRIDSSTSSRVCGSSVSTSARQPR